MRICNLIISQTAVSVVQPEFVGLDGALIGDLVTEAAADAAGDVLGGLASDAVEGISSTILEDGAEEVVNEADMTLFESISQSLDKYTGCKFDISMVIPQQLTNTTRLRQHQQNPQPCQRCQQHPHRCRKYLSRYTTNNQRYPKHCQPPCKRNLGSRYGIWTIGSSPRLFERSRENRRCCRKRCSRC